MHYCWRSSGFARSNKFSTDRDLFQSPMMSSNPSFNQLELSTSLMFDSIMVEKFTDALIQWSSLAKVSARILMFLAVLTESTVAEEFLLKVPCIRKVVS